MLKEIHSERPPSEILKRGRQVDQTIKAEVSKVVYGPELSALVDILTLAVFADGHVVVRAPVGMAKTLACSAMAHTLGGTFSRFQFVPDMMPTDLKGNRHYNLKTQEYEVFHGPLYKTNIFLADEINRATPKAQAALLEAMEERHLTIGGRLFDLEPVFIVLATRNPIEHEGTYDLPEAQLDRFLAQPIIKNISEETGLSILRDPDFWRRGSERLKRVNQVTTPEEIINIREAIFTRVHLEPEIERYIWRLRAATWEHEMVEYGSSPRGAIDLQKAAMVSAFLAGPREFELPSGGIVEEYFVTPEDVQRYAVDIMAHRIFLKPRYRHDPTAKSPAAIVREVLNAVKPD